MARNFPAQLHSAKPRSQITAICICTPHHAEPLCNPPKPEVPLLSYFCLLSLRLVCASARALLRCTSAFVFILSGAKILSGNPGACASLVGNDGATDVLSGASDRA
jgi:hypothetical protein